MIKISLSLLVDTISDIVEDWNDKFDAAFLSMTKSLKSEDGLYQISESNLSTLPLSAEQQAQIFERLKNYRGTMPQDDFDITLQLRGNN